MELLLFWVLCGVVAAVVASNKGNSGVSWFFMGVLLGPIGLILSLVVSGDPAVVERKKIWSADSSKPAIPRQSAQ